MINLKRTAKAILIRSGLMNCYKLARDRYDSSIFGLKRRIRKQLKAFDLTLPSLEVKPVPKISQIEITNGCNLNCVMCQTKESKRSVGIMNRDLFVETVKQIRAAGIKKVALHTVGETFIHKDLDWFVDHLHSNGLKVHISTNAQFPDKMISLKRNHPEAIERYRISLEAVTKKKYEIFRRGGKFELLMETFEKIQKYNESNSQRINVSIKALIGDENLDELLDIVCLKDKYQFISDVNFNLINTNNATNNDESQFLKLDKKVSRNGSQTSSLRLANLFGGYEFCRQAFSGAHVTYNGDVTLCCRDYEADLTVGNVTQANIKEIWTNAEANALRRSFVWNENDEYSPPTTGCVGCTSAIASVLPLVNDYIKFLHKTGKKTSREEFGESIRLFLNDLNDHAKKHIVNDIYNEMKIHL